MDHLPVLTGLRRVVEYYFVDDFGAPNKSWLAAIVLQFAEAELVLEADPSNDEAVLRVEQQATLQHWSPEDAAPHDVTCDLRWSDLIGANSLWRWQLTNQQGYRDGAQVEFSRGTDTTTRQWVAAASHLYEATVGS